MGSKSKVVWKSKKEMVTWHLVNSALAGGLVFVGAVADGSINFNEIIIASGAAGFVAITKFKEFWDSTQKARYSPMLFHFIH